MSTKTSKLCFSVITALSIMFSMSSGIVMANTQSDDFTEKAFLIVAENEKGYEKIENNYDSYENLNSQENHMAVIDMTLGEAERLREDKDIAFVEEDIIIEGSDFEGKEDSKLSVSEQHNYKMKLKKDRQEVRQLTSDQQWNIDMVNANKKEYKTGNDIIKVAVIDSGVTASDYLPVKERINFIEGENDIDPLYEDVSGHGTSVASVIIGSDDGYGVTGINPNAELYSLRVLDEQKKAPLSKVVEGIYWCIEHNIDIINMSFGTTSRSSILEKAIQDAEEHGILMVAAAGNHGKNQNKVEYPAGFDEVIAVGATNSQGEVCEFSSDGGDVELYAPGEKVPVTGFFDEIISVDGTSVAAPHITAAASVLWSKDRTKPAHFIRDLLKASAKYIDDVKQYGLIDLDYALSIYKNFAENYCERKPLNKIKKNKEPIETFEDEQVEALWKVVDHQAAVGLSDVISASVLHIMKSAQDAADNVDFLKGSNGDQLCFHGYGNYIANYMYLMRIARICYKKDVNYALSNAKYPLKNIPKSCTIIKDRIKKLYSNFSDIAKGYRITNNKENRARFIVGLAIHTSMDAYSHRSYIKKDNEWKLIPSHTKEKDDKNYIPNRYSVAKNVAYDIIETWHNEMEPDAMEFYQDEHKANVFRMKTIYTFVKNADKNTYFEYAKWFKAHSCLD